MVALGDNVHLYALPRRREQLIRTFEVLAGAGTTRMIDPPGGGEPMLLVGFPDGGYLSVEFTDAAPDTDAPRLGAWLELRVADPAALMSVALAAGLTEVHHPSHPHYLMIPGGQVFAIAQAH